MGLGSFLKKTSPLSVDRKIAGKVTGPLAAKLLGEKAAAPINNIVANEDVNKPGTLKDYKRNIGPVFRTVDRAGGKFTPLQIDNAIARKSGNNPVSRFVTLTTTRGPEDGSNNWYYDSNRNAAIAGAIVGASFGATAFGGESGAAGGASGSEGLYAVNSFDSGAMASSVGYTSPGWAGGSSGLLAENAFDSGAMWQATASETPWYEGLWGKVADQGGKALIKALSPKQDAPTYGAGAAFDVTNNTPDDSAGQDSNDLALWGLLGFITLLGLAAVAKKKGLLHV